jgi:hypothetical protein
MIESTSSQFENFVSSEILFVNDLNIDNANSKIINKYVIYLFNEYAAANIQDYDLWEVIQINFTHFQTKHFDQLKESIWKLVRNYCYSREYWTNHNFEVDRTRIFIMLETINAKWNDQWTLEQINWIEKRYDVIFRKFRMRKKKLTDVNVDVSDSVESQLRRDIRFQTSQNQL